MRPVILTMLLTLALALGIVNDAPAQSAWLLWSQRIVPDQKWTRLRAFPTYEMCQEALEQTLDSLRALSSDTGRNKGQLTPGVRNSWVIRESTLWVQMVPGEPQIEMLVGHECWPETIDPRRQ